MKWTEKAASMIAGQEYRYISPVITLAKNEVKTLVRAALTNNPNLNALTALFSTQPPNEEMEKSVKDFLAQLAKILGLDENADQEKIIATIQELTTANHASNPDPSQFVPIQEFEKVLNNLNSVNQGVALQTAELHVSTQIRNGNMPPYLKNWGVALCGVNKPAFDAFIERTKGMFTVLSQPMCVWHKQPQLHSASLSSDEQDVCERMGLTSEEFENSKKFIAGAGAKL